MPSNRGWTNLTPLLTLPSWEDMHACSLDSHMVSCSSSLIVTTRWWISSWRAAILVLPLFVDIRRLELGGKSLMPLPWRWGREVDKLHYNMQHEASHDQSHDQSHAQGRALSQSTCTSCALPLTRVSCWWAWSTTVPQTGRSLNKGTLWKGSAPCDISRETCTGVGKG